MTASKRSQPTQARRETWRSLRGSPVFAFYAVATLLVAGYIGLMVGQMALGLNFFRPGLFGQMEHGTTDSHRVHDVTYGLLIATTVVGVVAQLRRPTKNVAGMVMALIAFVALVLVAVLSDEFEIVVRRTPFRLVAAVAIVAALVHPAGRHFFRSFRVTQINWVMVTLVGLATVPLLSFASTNIRLQGTVRDEHFFQGHYAFMAAWGLTVVGVGLLASLCPDGWRVAAWTTGILSALLGITSVLYPDSTSSLDLGWALTAIAWGVAFVAVAELTKSALRSPPADSHDVASTAERLVGAQRDD